MTSEPRKDAEPAGKGRIETVIGSARETAESAYSTAVDKTSAAYEAAREKTSSAYSSAREAASTARDRAGAGIEDNPLAALVGGLALGALAGAIIPRSQKEIEALAPIGDRLRTAAGSAGKAAKAAAIDKIGELGLNPEDLVSKARTVVSEAAAAAQAKGRSAEADGSS